MVTTKLSIIVTCYNNEKYIERCLQSIINQLTGDEEIILVEDCSEDGSLEICRNYTEKFSDIVLIEHKYNMGVEQTRNDGLKASKGEWIWFVDGDDIISENSLNKLYNLINYDSDILIARFEYFDGISNWQEKCGLKNGKTYNNADIIKSIGCSLNWPMVSCIGNKLYKREYINKKDIRFNQAYKYNEDGAFAVEALGEAFNVQYLDFCIYRYRQVFGGTMTSYSPNSFFTVDKVNELLLFYLKKNKATEEQYIFLCKKRLFNLIDMINKEIRYGGKKSIQGIVCRLKKERIINDIYNELINTQRGSEFEITYLKMLKDGEMSIPEMLGKKESELIALRRWNYKNLMGENLFVKLKKRGISHLAIYGAGKIGIRLSKEAIKGGLVVDYFIDARADDISENNIICKSLDDEIEKTDVIITSVLTWNSDVIETLKRSTDIEIVSIWELLI